MLTIDVQVHAYERNHPGRPWLGTLQGPAEVTGDQMVAAMDAVGVDGAVLVSPFSMYGYDASYAIEVHKAHPGMFGLVKPVDPNDPGVADTIADWAATKGTVGIRIMMRDSVSTDPADPGINRVLAAAARHSLAVNLLCWGRLEQAGKLAARNPNTRLVIDHLGLQQPFEPPPAQPWAELPKMQLHVKEHLISAAASRFPAYSSLTSLCFRRPEDRRHRARSFRRERASRRGACCPPEKES